jgi:hypothetical protein
MASPQSIPVLTPAGKVTWRRGVQRTEPGCDFMGNATRFPVGGLVPAPRRNEGVAEMPEGSPIGWRIFRT